MASVNKVTCPECKIEHIRAIKQVNVVIKKSGKWRCQKCVLTIRNKAHAKPIGSTRTHNRTGYVLEKTENGWVRQHMYVMEKHIGRALLPDEDIHHINFIKTDNCIENLIILSHAEHTTLHNLERNKNGVSQ